MRKQRGLHNTRVPKDLRLPVLDACSRDDDARLQWLLGQGARAEGIHIACESKALNALSVLIEAGADPNEKSVSGLRPLHACCMNDAADCTKLLLACGANPNLKDNRGLTTNDYIDLYGASSVAHALSTFKHPNKVIKRASPYAARINGSLLY